MTYPKSKKEITVTVLDELPEDIFNPWKEMTLDNIIFSWWQTGRSGSGLRLSEQGMQAFAIANISHYDFHLDPKKVKASDWNIFIGNLTKKLACPYYLGVQRTDTGKNPYIRIYDHKIAMMLTLYGDLHEYMNSVK